MVLRSFLNRFRIGGTKKLANEFAKYIKAMEMDPRLPRIGTMKLDDTFIPISVKDIPTPKVTTFPIE